jgi:tetratricopeptide (TPR) repeat protein
MTILLLVLLAPTGLDEADVLAARARALKGDAKQAAVDKAMAAYDAVLRKVERDRKLAPRVRRRRAALLKSAGRLREALAEHDAIVAGRSRRADKARALVDGARLVADRERAIERLDRAIDRFPDESRTRARAARMRGELLEGLGRPEEAARSYRLVVEKCRFEEKEAIAAFDALALLELRRGRPAQARRWIRRCFEAYEKRAARGDGKGIFLGRQLGAMKAPVELARAEAAARAKAR